MSETLRAWGLRLVARLRWALFEGSSSPREEAFDVARAFAIAAMVCINFPYMLMAPGPGEGLRASLRWLLHVPSGRSSSLFVTLAGVGISMMARSAFRSGEASARARVRRTLVRRGVVLLALGLSLYTVWNIDILHFYGVYLLLTALFFVFAPAPVLFVAMGALLALGVVLEVWPLPDFGGGLYTPLGFVRNAFFDGVHPVVPWLVFVLYGVWLGRKDFADPTWRRSALAVALLSVGLLELASMGLTASLLVWRNKLLEPHLGLFSSAWTPEPLYVLSACATATLVIGLSHELLALVRRTGREAWLKPLVSSGQMALSLYLAHALFGVVIPVRLGLGRALAIEWVALHVATFVIVAFALATLWRRYFARGPLEAFMRAITSPWASSTDAQEMRAPTGPEGGGVAAALREPAGPALRAGAETPASSRVRLVMAGLGACLCLGIAVMRLVGGPVSNLPLSAGTSLSSLSLLRPRQVRRLSLEEESQVVLTTRSGLDLMLELRDDTHAIAVDDDSGIGVDARIEATLAAGSYDVEVRPYAATTGPYALDITVQPVRAARD